MPTMRAWRVTHGISFGALLGWYRLLAPACIALLGLRYLHGTQESRECAGT